MSRSGLWSFVSRMLTLLVVLLVSSAGFSQVNAKPLITQAIDNQATIVLKGNVHPLANAANDRGLVTTSQTIKRVMLVLKRSPEQTSALAAAIDAIHRPGSPTFHKWMSADQLGKQYGPSQTDLDRVTQWLQGQGLTVTALSKSHTVIEFSGSAQSVSSAFHTELHHYSVEGKTYTGNAMNPQIPAALAPVVLGPVSLNNFPLKRNMSAVKLIGYDKASKKWSVKNSDISQPAASSATAKPELTVDEGSNGYVFPIGPADFAKIYNVQPLWDAGIDGTGQQIAILAQSNIDSSDVDKFRAAFGLPVKPVNVILNGPDPGMLTADVVEATLDAQWSGAVAKNATIDFIVSGTTDTTDGILLSAFYAIDNQVAPVASLSYGACEVDLGTDGNFFFYQLWQQAAAEGITPIVAAGDSGSDTCEQGSRVSTLGDSVSGFASTPYNVSIGGTDFKVSITNPTQYWNQNNDPVTLESALSYIPEVPWDGSCAGPDVDSLLASNYRTSDPEALCNLPVLQGSFLQLNGGGGGVSSCAQTDVDDPTKCVAGWPQPDWQKGIFGIPDDKARYMPDISLFGSNGVFNSVYMFCYAHAIGLTTDGVCDFTDPADVQVLGAGGTSFGAPAFAGIMALVNQKTHSPQGVANYVLYDLARTQYGTTSTPVKNSCDSSLGVSIGASCTFNDISTGSNAEPCATGTPGCVTKSLDDSIGILAGFNSSPGFDPVTGLGSINAYNLVTNWGAIKESATATTLSITPSTSTYGQPLTLAGAVTSTVGSGTPTGTVMFLGLQGAAQTSFDLVAGSYSGSMAAFPAGTYNVNASYMGDGEFNQSSSSASPVTISRASTTGALSFRAQDPRSGIVLATGNQIPYGTAAIVTYTAQGLTSINGIQPPTGTVSFSQAGGSAGDPALTGTQAAVSLIAAAIGPNSIDASYDGDSNYLRGTPVTGSYTVIKGVIVLAAHAASDVAAGTGAVTLTANLLTHSYAAPPAGTVNFYVNGVLAGTVPAAIGLDVQTQAWAGSATLPVNTSALLTGTNLITASYSGDSNYDAVALSAATTLLYSPTTLTPAITLTADRSAISSDQPVTLSASVMLNQTAATVGVVTFKDGATILATVPVVGAAPATGSTTGIARLVATLPSGTHTIVAVYGGVHGAVAGITSSPVAVSVTGSQSTTTRIAATQNATVAVNYDLQVQLLTAGLSAPTGTLTLNQTGFNGALGQITIDPATAKVGALLENTLSVTGTTQLMSTADYNGDGIPDIAVARAESLSESASFLTNVPQLFIFLGKGDGTFQAGLTSTISADPYLALPYTVVSGDFNTDGINDIALGFEFGGGISVLLGKGDGTFFPGPTISIPGGLPALNNLVVADFNHDGILDLAASEAASGDLGDSGGLLTMLGNGDGSFQLQPRIDRPGTRFIRTADVNQDGNDDLLYSLPYRGTVGVILGNGDGTFGTESMYPAGGGAWELGVGDVNGDGYPDIATPNKDDNTVSVLINKGDGTFTSTSYPVGKFPQGAAIGDINHDGFGDVVVANNTDSTLTIFYGNANGTLSTGKVLNTGANPEEVILTDLNHDGTADIILAENQAGTAGVFLNGTTVTGLVKSVALAGATTEQESIIGVYSGDATYSGSTSQALTLAGSGGQVPTHAVWTPSVITNGFGVALPDSLFNARESSSIEGLFSYSAQLAGGQSLPLLSGTILPSAGSYSLTATFKPKNSTDFAASTATVAYIVTKTAVTSTLSIPVTQIAQGASISFTDVVASTTSGVPTGAVTFYAGTSSLGVSPLDGTGTATVSTTLLPLGTTSITASYSGDSNFTPATSTGTSIVAGPSMFAMTPFTGTMTIQAGGSGTVVLSVAPQFGYTGNITLSCGSLFPGASCSFSPSAGALGAGGLQSTITVTTAAPTKTTAQVHRMTLFTLSGGTSLAWVLLLFRPRKGRSSVWLALLLATAVTSLTLGCSSGSPKGDSTLPPGSLSSSLSLSSSSAKAASNSAVTLEATVAGSNASTALGTISFYEGSTLLGQPVNVQKGAASLSLPNLPVGVHSLTAMYSGDTYNSASTSLPVQQVITGSATVQIIGTSNGVTQTLPLNISLE